MKSQKSLASVTPGEKRRQLDAVLECLNGHRSYLLELRDFDVDFLRPPDSLRFRVAAAFLADDLRAAFLLAADFLLAEPPFSPPPVCLLTVAHARRSASSSLTPFSS